MSGFLSGLPVTVEQLYDSLLDASYGGVTFSILDSRHEIGRRVQRFWYPGRDDTGFQDLGAFDGTISITGLVNGDDYVYQAQKLHTAFRTPGPTTLVHPWLGTLQVILEKPATIHFDHKELRIARFEAQLTPYVPFVMPPPDTLQSLLDAIDDLKSQAQTYLAGILAPALFPLAAFAYAQRAVGEIASYWSIATGTVNSIIGAAAAPAIAALTAPVSGPGAAWAATVVANLTAVPDAIAASSVPTPPAAVAPGGSVATPAAADPRTVTTLLLAGCIEAQSFASDAQPGPGLSLAVQAITVADAVSAASDIPYTSQQDALTTQALLLAAIDATILAAATQAQVSPSAAGAVWRNLQLMRAAFLMDMSAVVGRLQPVETLTITSVQPAWLIAQYLSGDTPSAVVSTYLDLVSRNKVAHPAMVPAGDVEYLA